MAKFLNKKEQVYDLKLTTYGHYLLSNGTFRPAYYGFFDDNIIYDQQYVNGSNAVATWTQVTGTPGNMATYTLILEDAEGNTHTLTFRNNSTYYPNSSSVINNYGYTHAAQIATQIATCIELARAEGLINISAVQRKYWDANVGTGDDLGAKAQVELDDADEATGWVLTNEVILRMTTAATAGTGKTITGTAIHASRATVTTFAGGKTPVVEAQNDIDGRIKEKSQYLESIVLFEDAEDYISQTLTTDDIYVEYTNRVYGKSGELKTGLSDAEVIGNYTYFDTDVNPTTIVPRGNIYKFDNVIGDAFFEGETQSAPAWKIVALNGNITSSAAKDETLSVGYDVQVPQVDMTLSYKLVTQDANFNFDPKDVRGLIDRTSPFADNKIVRLEMQDALIYMDEVNTQLLTENFDIEVFEVIEPATTPQAQNLNRKYFEKKIPQVVDGFMVSATEKENSPENLTTTSVEYYFDVLVDDEIDRKTACKGAEVFNKQSYYVDLDFDCDMEAADASYYDIYGSVTEPEICQS
tara:strand:+ start:500 stop:2071 length:1572 start_codon:yes stop_codon:yes gene_type:complete